MIRVLYIILVCHMPILDNFLPKTNFGAGIPDIGPARLTSYILIVVFCFEVAINKQAKLFSKWVGYMIIFSIIVTASVFWSNYSYSFSVIQNIFDAVLVPVITAVIGLHFFQERDNINVFLKNIIVAMFILSIISIYQLASKGLQGQLAAGDVDSFVRFGNEVRSSGTLGNPNALAIFLVLTIPCLIYVIEKKLVPKKFGWVLSASLIGGIICTISRKGMVTGVLAFCLYYFLKGKFKKILAMGIVVVTLTLILSTHVVISNRFSQDELNKQFAGKWAMTYAGWDMFKKSPIIGLGYKGYYENFGRYFPWSRKNKYDAHNIFITALANYGLIGFIPFLGIFLYPLLKARKSLKNEYSETVDSTQKELAIICVSSIIPLMFSGWFAGGLFYNPVLIILLYANISLFLSRNI